MEIKYAVLHNPIFVPGPSGKGFNLGPTLDTENVAGTSKGLKMDLAEGLLRVTVGGVDTLLPTTSVLHMVPAKGAKIEPN